VSIHRGTVVSNVDPTGLGRLQVTVPALGGHDARWALSLVPLGTPEPGAPVPVGALVTVAREDDDAESLIVLGRLSPVGSVTPAELAVELGHDDGGRPGWRVRRFLRERYPDHPSHERWQLTPEQVDEVRAHFGR